MHSPGSQPPILDPCIFMQGNESQKINGGLAGLLSLLLKNSLNLAMSSQIHYFPVELFKSILMLD